MNWRRWKTRSAGLPLKDQAMESRQFNRRAMTAFIFILLAIALLSLRYVYLQFISFEEFTARSISNQVRIVPVVPNRGLIYDRRGRPVAENRPAYRLELVPEKVKETRRATINSGDRDRRFRKTGQNRSRSNAIAGHEGPKYAQGS